MLFHLITFLAAFHYAFSICPDGSVAYYTDPSMCFLFHSEPKNFIDAEGICIGLNGHLASVHNMFENLFISGKAASNFTESSTSDFWFGANKDLSPGSWSWMDGTPFDFTDWGKGEPQNISDHDCGAMNLQNGQWLTDDCFKNKPFVCLIVTQLTTNPTTALTTTTTTTPSTRCHWGWTYYNTTGYCYMTFVAPWIWIIGEDNCKVDGAHLASIHSLDEALFLANLATYSAPDCDSNVALVGFHTEDNTHWRWTDDTSFDFPNWSPGSPVQNGNCGAIYLSSKCNYKAGQFINYRCGLAATRFICKMKPF